MRDLETEGIWWLPANPADKVAGILTYSFKDGLRLSLIGTFGSSHMFGGSVKHPIVHGLIKEDVGGREVTLAECFVTDTSMTAPGFASEKLIARTGYFGAFLEEPDLSGFASAEFEFTHLGDWVPDSGFSSDLKVSKDGRLEGYSLTYRYPAEEEVTVSDGTVALTYSVTVPAGQLRDIRLVERVRIKVAGEPRSFETFNRDYMYPIQNLLSFATSISNATSEVVLYSPKFRYEGVDAHRPIRILFQPVFYQDEPPRKVHPKEMLFLPAEVGGFSALVTRWLLLSKKYARALQVFFAVEYKKDQYLDTRFLSVVTAIEAFSRSGGAEASSRERVPNDSAPDSPEPLHALIERGMLILGIRPERIGPFSLRVVGTRDYLVHGIQRGTAAAGPTLFNDYQFLTWVFKAMLLNEIGLPDGKVQEIIGRNNDYNFLIAQLWQNGRN